MILVADSGATKTHWVLLDKGKVQLEVYSKGFNPYYYKADDFTQSLMDEFIGKISFKDISAIYFYAAGCSSKANANIIQSILSKIFVNASIFAHHDLYGAAIALLGNEKGIACILGTGSNSCLWDGQTIIHNVPSVGYLLGDEGGGTYTGKLLVREILLGIAPLEVSELFYDSLSLNFSSVLDRIYKEPNPNQFLSQQTRFLREFIDKPYCRDVVSRSFNDFVDVQLINYPGVKSLPASFTGSVAANFKDILKEVLNDHGIKMGKIIKEPMEGLIAYHSR